MSIGIVGIDRAKRVAPSVTRFRWSAVAVSTALVALVGSLDYVTGKDAVFTLFYLAPISIAIWFAGRKTGLAFCFLSAAIGLAVELADHALLGKAVWNACVWFGVYLVIYELLVLLKAHHVSVAAKSTLRRLATVALGGVFIWALASGLLPKHWISEGPSSSSASAISLTSVKNLSPQRSPLEELAVLVDTSMRTSRPVLLGSRDPKGPSCVKISRSGDVVGAMPDTPGDLNGGPGTTFATIYFFARQNFKSPREDYVWHQTRLKTYFENVAVTNRSASGPAHELAEKSRQLWEAANEWTEISSDVVSIGYIGDDDWPSYCLAEIDKAVAAKDLNGVRRWSGELASAAFSLEDLHRWLGFLVDNHLAALEFQRQCEGLFDEAEALHRPYDPSATISQFPAGVLSLNGKGNYYEVERQAERLFSMPADRIAEIAIDKHLTPGSLWVSPVNRKSFLELQGALSPDNQKTWEQAARAPFQHSYLINMLFRAQNSEIDDDLYTVLKKFDALHPHATIGELLNELQYRGHSFAGLEWDDRFRPELVKAADEISLKKTDDEAFLDAWKWTNDFYQAPSAQYGVTFTLRDALDQKRLDCVRATDMIASIYRNSGRVGMGHIRWSSATCGHSVAAHLVPDNLNLKVSIGDGLTPPHEPENWPDCYFHGHAWPASLQDNAPPYAAELYMRGLDGYIWAEGYIIRGPTAGTFTSVDIPYSTHHHEQFSKKIFNGPYP